MADVRPFRGLRYHPSVAPELGDVICPPYDIVSAADEAVLQERSPYNAIRLELREDHDGSGDTARYDKAADLFRQWLDRRVLVPESSPAMYLVEEEFLHKHEAWQRHGLTVAVRLEEFDKGIVMPHEFTRPGPKMDRLALMRACRTNFSPIMSLYRDQRGEIADVLARIRQESPIATVPRNGHSGYRVWPVTQPDVLSSISDAMSSRQIFVADGHHRYETALQFRDEMDRAEGPLPADSAARFVMMTLISMDAPGLLVLPYHRVLGGLSDDERTALRVGLEQAFEIRPAQARPEGHQTADLAQALETDLDLVPKDRTVAAVFGLEPGETQILTLRDAYRPPPDAPSLEKCDMWLVHQKGIRPALGEERESAAVTFVHDSKEALEMVRDGRSQVAFLLRPLPMDLFEQVVGRGERLPPKSTYFYPKLPTGLVINRLEGAI